MIHQKIPFMLGCLVLLTCYEGLEAQDKFRLVPLGPAFKVKIQKDTLSRIISESLTSIERSIQDADALDKTFFDKGIDQKGVRSMDFFGPHLLTSPRARDISHVGLLFMGVAKSVVEKLLKERSLFDASQRCLKNS
ncbi:hypothetical protein CHS0354_038590 [Potamilus streckersoni]|uniref:Uncharacterized protein n=1 Tax=Potamilus streckersoni TaxID=2493646 RepID=A0AAE0TFR3_9BIVA|nr:hypothetical protein CHS0354_038590 [Potamilus streckersoni]